MQQLFSVAHQMDTMYYSRSDNNPGGNVITKLPVGMTLILDSKIIICSIHPIC